MALVSPGVQVSVIDESFYTPAEPGTTPMIFVATAQDKANASGTGTAQGTLAANAGVPYLLTSQRDLADTFGDPVFQVDSNNNPIHGSELNEYGLQAAYSYLGVSNRAWVVRANIDLDELSPSADAPAATPADGTYWLDTSSSLFGVFEWNGNSASVTGGQSFTNQVPVVITDTTQVVNYAGEDYTPKASIGAVGDYAMVALTTVNTLWYKNSSGNWVEVGSEDWAASWPTIRGTATPSQINTTGTIEIDGTTVAITSGDTVSDVADTINSVFPSGPISADAVDGRLEIYSYGAGADSTPGGALVVVGDNAILTELGIDSSTYYPPALQISRHTSVPEFKTTDTAPRPTGSVWLKTTTPNLGARWRVKIWNDETKLWENVEAPIYDSNADALVGLDLAGGGINLPVGSVYVQSNVADDTLPMATFKIYRRENSGATTVTSAQITESKLTAGDYTFTVAATTASSLFSTPVTISAVDNTGSGGLDNSIKGLTTDADTVAGLINSANIANVVASVDSQNRVVISHTQGGEIRFVDTDGLVTVMGLTAFVSTTSGTPNLYYVPGTDGTTSPQQLQASNWKVLSYTASDNEVTALTTNGRLWYNSIVDEVDILVNTGTEWVGYQYDGVSGISGNASPYYTATGSLKTDPNGPIVTASEPTLQSDGTALVNGDIWIDTADLENYPQIYRYNAATQTWDLLDKADQTTENGVLFADARYATSGAASDASDIVDLLASDYVDPDCPDPALYPKGMLLWNLRRSGFNVKRFERNYIDTNDDNIRFGDEDMSTYYPHRWVTESGNQADGSGSFGRNAQRKVVVQALQAMVNSNEDIRDNESRIFNLLACPGYPELIGELISLNYDRGLDAFIVGDSPFRLTPDATSLNDWATNVNTVVEDNDQGLISRDEYLGVFYPSGFTSDNFGNNVVVPPSHMMLRTIALSDQVSFPWFAPAGTRRGGITNASSTGYIDNEGEFVAVALNEGQRDTLYTNSVNPITFITGAGLVNYGQKTRSRGASSLDRINVARLVIYLRSQLNQLAKPYIFEPNDKITRDEIKQAAESLLLELVGQRALYDFLVVCDESNNTPSRIDRNELYLDIAIEPVKAVEFIYIPLRLKNTGEIAGL